MVPPDPSLFGPSDPSLSREYQRGRCRRGPYVLCSDSNVAMISTICAFETVSRSEIKDPCYTDPFYIPRTLALLAGKSSVRKLTVVERTLIYTYIYIYIYTSLTPPGLTTWDAAPRRRLPWRLRAYIYIYIYTHICIHVCLYIYIYIYTYIHMYNIKLHLNAPRGQRARFNLERLAQPLGDLNFRRAFRSEDKQWFWDLRPPV